MKPDPLRLLRLILPTLLIFEGLYSAVRIAELVPTLMVYDGVTLTLLAVRAVVSGVECAAGWWLRAGRPVGRPLARWALLASALLLTVEIGARLAPSDLDPAFRWPFVAAYWAYALVAVAWLWKTGR